MVILLEGIKLLHADSASRREAQPEETGRCSFFILFQAK